ncbi:MAG: twin-arginine translocase TatA/TatE family subunit [Bacteroidales bacterium]|nr:twin-arginine translocase TatA/TatE family subunit [Bacteroidales bacterium]
MIAFLVCLLPAFIGTTELILIGGIALLLFGGKKLPEMMRGLGRGVKEFKHGMGEHIDETTQNVSENQCDEVHNEVIGKSDIAE